MDYKKIVPAVALSLGVAAAVNTTQAADLFQMAEVSGHGTLIACDGAKGEHHCGAEKKDGEHHCGAEKADKKDAGHKCAADKKGEHPEKEADSKCAAGACGADKK